MITAITLTATVFKPTIENGAWVRRPFVLRVAALGKTDRPVACGTPSATKQPPTPAGPHHARL
jgi:hypothetical protein